QAFDAVKQASNEVLSTSPINGVEKWGGWRTKLGDLIITKLGSGELATQEQIAEFLLDVSRGLSASSAEAPALDPAILAIIVRIVLALLDRLFGGGGGGFIPDGPV